jgi:hydroxymethylbilane synthase
MPNSLSTLSVTLLDRFEVSESVILLLRVGTRGSRLSLIQTDMLVKSIERANPSVKIERKIIASSGDLDRKTPLFSLSQKGIFEKEVDQAVLDGKVDFAVHSMKDVPTLLNAKLTIASVPERGATADVLVSEGAKKLKEILDGRIVGTSSLLRAAQLRRVRPGLRAEPIRGNVDTRVEKVERGDYDGVILAEAGLARLGMIDRVAERLSLDDFIPAPGQGALAVVAQRRDFRLLEILKTVEHSPTRAEAEAERELVKVLEGGCKIPVGAIASAKHGTIRLTASIFSLDGKQQLLANRNGTVDNPRVIGKEAGEELLEKGAKEIEETWRTAYS